jgi:hypothetical protein
MLESGPSEADMDPTKAFLHTRSVRSMVSVAMSKPATPVCSSKDWSGMLTVSFFRKDSSALSVLSGPGTSGVPEASRSGFTRHDWVRERSPNEYEYMHRSSGMQEPVP